MEKIIIEQVIQETESLAKEIRFSKIKTLIELFLTSFVILFWSSLFWKIGFASGIFRIMLIVLPLLNGISWLLWISSGYLYFFHSLSSRNIKYREYEYDSNSILHRYEYYLYILKRQRRLESLIDVFVGGQFLFIFFSLIFQFMYVG